MPESSSENPHSSPDEIESDEIKLHGGLDQTATVAPGNDVSAPIEPPTHPLRIIRCIGPGLIVAGSIVGSGELIATT